MLHASQAIIGKAGMRNNANTYEKNPRPFPAPVEAFQELFTVRLTQWKSDP